MNFLTPEQVCRRDAEARERMFPYFVEQIKRDASVDGKRRALYWNSVSLTYTVSVLEPTDSVLYVFSCGGRVIHPDGTELRREDYRFVVRPL